MSELFLERDDLEDLGIGCIDDIKIDLREAE
jgi:hypothetical protein